jgi:putative ABC transport system ATP-binding protein
VTDVAVRDLVVEFPAGDYIIRPLDNVTLDVPSGSLTILLGPSGCGKTTLLSCLAGILTPTSGSIRVGGTEVTELRGTALTQYRRHQVGVVFQAFNLVPSLTAAENVAAPMLAAGMRTRDARSRARTLLGDVALSERLEHRPGDLSGGQQQRVAIARSLAHDPPLVIADEPTAHLDYVQVEGILRLVRGLAAPGRAVIVATHDDRILPLADQVIELTPRAAPPREPTRVELAHGQVLFEEGARSDLVYIIESGEIEIVRRRPEGGEQQVAVLGRDDYFGEMGPIFNLPRSAQARALGENVVVIGYALPEFRELIGAEHLKEVIEGRKLQR